MSEAFRQVGAFKSDNLIAGNQVPLLTRPIELEVGEGTLKRGSVISIGGTLAILTDTVDGILTDDVALSSTDKTYATVYITGEFNSDFIEVGADSQVSDFVRDLRTLGIYIK